MRKKDEEVASLQAALERFTVAVSKKKSIHGIEYVYKVKVLSIFFGFIDLLF